MNIIYFSFTALSVLLFTSISTANNASSSQEKRDKSYMQIALEHANGNPQAPFAALIVDNKTGKILCKGLNTAKHNPTWHGEIVAINKCSSDYFNIDWSETTLYTTAEPCPMCQSAIVWANISRVVYGTSIAYLENCGWEGINIYSHLVNSKASFYKGTITDGVLADKTNPLFCPRKK